MRRHGVRAASGALAELTERAGLANDVTDGGGVLLAGSDAVLSQCSARWLDQDPARALDAGLPAICAAEWIADLHRALRPDLPAFVVRPGVDNVEMEDLRDIGGDLPSRRLRVFGDPRIVAGMTEPAERVDTEEEARVVLDLTPSVIVVRRKPVVATLVPGRQEVVKHGVNGLLVEPDDLRGAARLLDLLARDADLRAELERGARELAWPTVDQSAQKLVEALDEIAALPKAQPAEPKPFLPRRTQSRAHPTLDRPRLRKLREALR